MRHRRKVIASLIPVPSSMRDCGTGQLCLTECEVLPFAARLFCVGSASRYRDSWPSPRRSVRSPHVHHGPHPRERAPFLTNFENP
jgi:hypothetical protein